MRIAMIGCKGIPAAEAQGGGIEFHVQELATRLRDRGHDVTVYVRPYANPKRLTSWNRIRLVTLPSVHRKNLDAITHTFFGIGAGPHCDGQILVLHDVLGLCDRFSPKFARRYAELWQTASDAIGTYADEVRRGLFPTDAHSFHSLATVSRDEKVAAKG